MSDDELAFLAAIYSDPDSDVPRLVFADWYEENGQPERAEYIRLACQISSGAGYTYQDDERYYQLEDRLSAIWTAHLPQFQNADRTGEAWEFRRGFPERLYVNAATLFSDWEKWASVPFVTELFLFDMVNEDFPTLAEHQWNPLWRELQFQYHPHPMAHNQFSDSTPKVCKFLQSPQLAQIRILKLFGVGLAERAIATLCETPHLTNLQELRVDKGLLSHEQLQKRFGTILREGSWMD